MNKGIATVLVLGGISLGSSVYAADDYQKAAFENTIQQLCQELKSEMDKQPAKKNETDKKLVHNPYHPEQAGKISLKLISSQLKGEDDKVAAGVNANVVINGGRLENMVVSGHAGLASVAMSIDARTGHSTTNLSYDDKKGSRADVTLRDGKDPAVSVATPLKFIKGLNFTGKFDSMNGYASARLSVNHDRVSGSVSYENINNKARTTATASYKLPIKHNTSVSLTRVDYDGLWSLSADVVSRIKGVNIGVSARRDIGGRITPYAVVSGNFKW